jgi:hypothetical protein
VIALAVLFVTAFPAKAFAGYTHYWTWLRTPDPPRLAACLDDMEKVVRARPDLVAEVDFVKGERIAFNGIGEQAHEPFIFPGDLGLNFTKTLWKPYDEVVTAALIVARSCFPVEELQIASDGEWSEWAPGRRLYEKTFGKDAPNPLLAAGERQPNRRENWIISACILGLGVVAWLVTRARRRR